MSKTAAILRSVNEVTNGGASTIAASEPYTVSVTIEGACDLLMHRWNSEAVDAKADAPKNSAAKKTDDVESYVYRDENGDIALPGEYLRQSIITAAKYKQDPRSPRKSACDLYKAGVVCLTAMASFGTTQWDYEDRRRVVIARSGINRTRPAMSAGWRASFDFMVLTPEYISRSSLQDTLITAGRLVGVGDFRPTYGRFNVINFK